MSTAHATALRCGGPALRVMKTNCAAASNVSRIGIKIRDVTAVWRIIGALVSVRQENSPRCSSANHPRERSSLLPADYCQLELPFNVQRTCAGIKTGML